MTKIRLLGFSFLLLIFLLDGRVLLASSGISVSSSSGDFALVSGKKAASIIVDAADVEVVKVAVQAFSEDIKLITGCTPAIKYSLGDDYPIIVGTLGGSAFINQLANNGKIEKSRLEGKWETFCISVVDNPVAGISKALVIAGSDPRGTAFGVFELSRMLGVSPWVWWADIVPESKESIYVSGDALFGPPSVKYRGMFINDEDFGMKPWAAKNMDTSISNIGQKTHEKIFELMLRTKSNYFWPAMHGCSKPFWSITENPAMARKYQIVMGSSHCEQLLRNNVGEWKGGSSNWNWSINKNNVISYWTERVQESKNTDAVYTLGMRGVHDEQMLGYSSDAQRAVAVKDIIANQRTILETTLGKPASQVPQIFCPYKEVLSIYNQGINLPGDVTLLWADDNHGFIRQLSNQTEQQRSGGAGVYYHLSYWGPPRQDYLWLASTSPVKISYEMSKAYDLNAKNIWVFNVGDLKPAEFEYQFAMDLAWDVNGWQPEKAHQYAKFWAEETFGSDLADAIAEIKKQHYYLSASGRPEQMDWSALTVPEMEQRLEEYAKLVDKVTALEAQIPERLQAGYFQLVTYPVICSASMNEKLLGAKLSFEYANCGKMTEALSVGDRANRAYRVIQRLTDMYNKEISGGKWNGMMDYSPKDLGFFFEPPVVTNEVKPSDSFSKEEGEQITSSISSKDYISKSANVKVIEELGVYGASLTVLPFNMISYTQSSITSAPSVEYKVKLNKGNNKITVKCLPTHPLYGGYDLRYALSVDGSTPQLMSIKTAEGENVWRSNILRGYAKGDMYLESDLEKEVFVKIYFADPGLVLSGIDVTSVYVNEWTKKIVNPDFEFDQNGNRLTGIIRGDPYGWTHTGKIIGNSFGTNQDAINYHGDNVCWYLSSPMPPNFELSQTIRNLPSGEYIVRCLLCVPKNYMTNQRLFANNKVQYFGKESDYEKNLTAGEINSFANYSTDYESKDGVMAGLREMAVKIFLKEGEELKIGIRSGNKKGDGTSITSDKSGNFKVDYFRLELVQELDTESAKTHLKEWIKVAEELYDSTTAGTSVGEYPQASRSAFYSSIEAAKLVSQNANATFEQSTEAIVALRKAIEAYKESVNGMTAYIVNPSFEYKEEGVLNDGTTVYGTPYGWQDTGFLGTSFGINNDANSKDGNNACWYKYSPMPSDFELYQHIGGLPAGEYTVRCRMAVPNNKITTQGLFANNNVQYYGFASDYKNNLAERENNSFAGWFTSGNYYLQEMEVGVVIAEGEILKLGARSSNIKSDGSQSTSDAGWFKVDHFRLELKELHGETKIDYIEKSLFKIIGEKGACKVVLDKAFHDACIQIFSLSGVMVYQNRIADMETTIALPRGLFIVRVTADGLRKSGKVFVR